MGLVTASHLNLYGVLIAFHSHCRVAPERVSVVYERNCRFSIPEISVLVALDDNLKYCNLLNSHMRKKKKGSCTNNKVTRPELQ